MDSVTNNLAGNVPSSRTDQSDLASLFRTQAGKSSTTPPPQEKLAVPVPVIPRPAPPPAGSALDEAEQLSSHWGDWGMHNGVDFNNPPSSLPKDAQDTIKYFGNNSVLYQAMIKDNGGTGNTLTKADVDQFIKDAKGDAQLADKTLPPGSSSDPTLADLSAIVANWHAWGLHSGDTPFSDPPPDNLPPDAKAALGDITSNPYLLSQIGNHTGSGPITQQDVANFLGLAAKNPVLLGQPAQDTHVQGWLDSLGDAVSDQDKSALAQNADDAQTLSNFFNAYPRGASELNSEVPPDVADAEKRLLGDDAIKKQLITSDGKVTRDTVGAFLGNLDKSADAAKSSWESFQKSAPNADPTVRQAAADASILQADSPILDEAGDGSKADGEISTQDLQSAASNQGDAGLPDALKHAAALFSSPGMFANLDIAGNDPATTKPDGLMDAANLGNFVSQLAPKMTPSSLITTLNYAATQNMTAGVDVSKLGPDVFQNPQNYSGAQKLAVLQKLQGLSSQIEAGAADDLSDNGVILKAQGSSIQANIEGKVGQLEQDPDVQTLLNSGQQTKELQSITNADPALKSALQGYYDGAVKNGAALGAALDAKDSSGNPVAVEQGLQDFMGQATTLSQALGADGKARNDLDLQDIAQKSGQEGKLEQAYKDDILSGNELSKAIAGGANYGSAVQQFTTDAANFGAILPSKLVADNAPALQHTFSDTLSTSLLGTNDISAFEDGSGNLDTGKLDDLVQQVQAQNPDAFKDANGNAISPAQVVSAFKGVFDTVRHGGGKLPDALSKIRTQRWQDSGEQGPKPGKPTGPVSAAYSQGLMHIVSGLFGAGVLAARNTGTTDTSSVAVNNIAGSFSVIGAIMEGGAKFTKTLNLDTGKPYVPSDATLKNIENSGKLLGGAANVMSGAFSIFSGVQSLNSGNGAAGGASIATGITNTWAGVAGLVEGGANLANSLLDGVSLSEETLGALSATSATLGIGAAVAGAGAALGLVIYQLVELDKNQDKFKDLVNPQLQQWGIPLPPMLPVGVGTGPNGYPTPAVGW